MERLVVFAALAYLGFGLLSEAHAKRIKHPTGGYSLDFPRGWAIEKSKGAYALAHSDGRRSRIHWLNCRPTRL
jgi:hypothetical protein